MSGNAQQAATVALVTGAARGIGYEVCRQLAAGGMTVFLGARDAGKAAEAAGRLAREGLDVRPVALDVTDDASTREAAAAIEREFGRLDVLVNNAAAFADWSEHPSTADLDSARATLETNLFGTWRVCQAFLPLLRRSPRGRLVNVSSGAGSHGDGGFGLATGDGATASYAISKAAVNALTAKLAAETAGSGLLVNAVCPGLTATAPGMEAMGARPIPEGAASVAWAAALPDDGPSGGFFRDGKPLPW
jgi:NAD(P)-dependent dehydrogenase (short-subunit alcohol dehydrogenase family)